MIIRIFNYCPTCGYKLQPLVDHFEDGVCWICHYDRTYPEGEKSLEMETQKLRSQFYKIKARRDALLKKIVDGGSQ